LSAARRPQRERDRGGVGGSESLVEESALCLSPRMRRHSSANTINVAAVIVAVVIAVVITISRIGVIIAFVMSSVDQPAGWRESLPGRVASRQADRS